MSRLLLTGNEAFAHAALEAGVGVVAGHPSNESSEVVETVARQVAKGRADGVSVEWSTSEKVALEVCAAASLSGLRSLFTCQQVGLNVASDALFALNCVGVRGGLVLFVTDDPHMNTAPRWQDTRPFAELAKVPIFDPSTPEQGVLMMKQAFELSESFGTPVIVRSTTRIGQSSTFFEVEDRTEALSPRGALGDGFASYAGDGSAGFVHDSHRWVLSPQVAGNANVLATPTDDERVREVGEAHQEIEARVRKIAHTFSFDSGCSQFNPISLNGKKIGSGAVGDSVDVADGDLGLGLDGSSRAKVGIACGGEATAVALEAIAFVKSLAQRAGVELPEYKMIQLGTPYPFPRRAILRFYKGLSDVLVLEELEPFMENELVKASGTSFLGPSIHGKLSGEVPQDGAISLEAAARAIARFFDDSAKQPHDAGKVGASASGASPDSSGPIGAAASASGASALTGATAGAAGAAADSTSTTFGAYSSISGTYGDFDNDFGDIDDGMGDDGASPEAASASTTPAVTGESKVKQRLAALQKHTKLAELVEQALGSDALYEYKGELPARPAVLCAGCPHRASLVAAKNAVSRLGIARNNVIFCGDVGCSTLGVFQPLEAIDTSLCMGAGLAMAQGFSLANPKRKCVAFVGDDSFFANGMTAIANAVWNKRDVTMIVLDNMTTAACGLQPNAGSGSTLGGHEAPSIDAEKVLRALGVEAVYRVDPLYLSDAEEVCMRALEFDGPSAVVMTSPCVCLRRNDKAAIVNVNKCTGCKKCMMETGCPAISLDVDARGAKSSRRGQAFIDTGQCTGCGLCAEVCPFQAIVVRKRGVIETALAQAKAQADARPSVRAADRMATAIALDSIVDAAAASGGAHDDAADLADERDVAFAAAQDAADDDATDAAWAERDQRDYADDAFDAPAGDGEDAEYQDCGAAAHDASGASGDAAFAGSYSDYPGYPDGDDFADADRPGAAHGSATSDEGGAADLSRSSTVAPARQGSPATAPAASAAPTATTTAASAPARSPEPQVASSEISLESLFGGQVKIDLGADDDLAFGVASANANANATGANAASDGHDRGDAS